MTILQKFFLSFFLAVFLIAGFFILNHTGVLNIIETDFNDPVSSINLFLFAAIFSTVFIIIFFVLNLITLPEQTTSPVSTEWFPIPDDSVNEIAELDELEIVEELFEPEIVIPENTAESGRGLLAAAMIYENKDDDSITLEDIEAIEVVSPFTSMFSSAVLQNNTLVLQESEEKTDNDNVIFEQDGIPYIDNSALSNNTNNKINTNFIKLVESVTNLTPSAP